MGLMIPGSLDVGVRDSKCWRKGGRGEGSGGGGRGVGAMGGRRRMERRVSGRMKLLLGLARCGRGRTGAVAPGAWVTLGMPVSFCTMSRNSLASVSKIVVGVRRDARGRRFPGGRDANCCFDDDDAVGVVSVVDCGNDVRQFWSVSTRDRVVVLRFPSAPVAGREFNCCCCISASLLLLGERRGEAPGMDEVAATGGGGGEVSHDQSAMK